MLKRTLDESNVMAWCSLLGKEPVVQAVLEQLWGTLRRQRTLDATGDCGTPAMTAKAEDRRTAHDDLRTALEHWLLETRNLETHPPQRSSSVPESACPSDAGMHHYALQREMLAALNPARLDALGPAEAKREELWGLTRHAPLKLLQQYQNHKAEAAVYQALKTWLLQQETDTSGPLTPGPADILQEVLRSLKEQWPKPSQEKKHMQAARAWTPPSVLALVSRQNKDNDKDEDAPKTRRYIETHVHFNGAVPFDRILTDYLFNDQASFEGQKEVWQCRRVVAQRLVAYLELHCPRLSGTSTPAEPYCRFKLLEHAMRRHLQHERCPYRAPFMALLCLEARLRQELLLARLGYGLDVFTEGYSGYSKAAKAIERTAFTRSSRLVAMAPSPPSERLKAILEKFSKHGTQRLELRILHKGAPAELRKKIQDYIRTYLYWLKGSRQHMALGFVISLHKQAQPLSTSHGRQCRESSDSDLPDVWDKQAEFWKEQVTHLLQALEEEPLLRQFVVGIDAASKERGCPPRALAQALEPLRAYHERHGLTCSDAPGQTIPAEEWQAELKRSVPNAPEEQPSRPHDASDPCDDSSGDSVDHLMATLARAAVPFRRLGITLHAGEDFVDPLSGLRHIDECLRYLSLKRGDRLGHAIALALTPQVPTPQKNETSLLKERLIHHYGESYATTPVQKPRGEHLLDLAWLQQLGLEDPWFKSWADEALRATLTQAFVSPRGLETARHILQSSTSQPALALPGVRYLNPREIDPEDQVLIHFDKQWQALFEEARLRVLKRVIDAGLVIESCPTSNRVVAGLTTSPIEVFLDEKRLYVGHRQKNQLNPVLPKVVLATDDPGIFDAWPSTELEAVKPGQRDPLYQAAEAATWIRVV